MSLITKAELAAEDELEAFRDGRPVAPPPPVDPSDAFRDGVKRLAEQHGITSVVLLFAIEKEGRARAVCDSSGSERLHAELAAQAYAAHVLPITQRAETLQRIAMTPARAATEGKATR